MKLADWPEACRRLWAQACAPADLLDDEIGARAGHREISNRKAENGYGRWLTFLASADPSALVEARAGDGTDRREPRRGGRPRCASGEAIVQRLRFSLLFGNGAPERIRTSDPQIRSLVLYPAELRAPVGVGRALKG